MAHIALREFHSGSSCRKSMSIRRCDVGEFIALIPDNPSLQNYSQVIQNGNFDDYTASLQVWAEALHHIQQQGVDAGINTEIPDFMTGLFDRAIEAGYAQKNVMSLIKVLQGNQ